MPLEWWYYTGHLADDHGDTWGFQVTFFKLHQAIDVYVGNFAVTDHQSDQLFFAEQPGFNAAQGKGYSLDVAGWSVSGFDGDDTISVDARDYTLELHVSAEKPAVLHGNRGITGSGPEATHYYSRTRLTATGTLTVQGEAHPVTGTAWMDHQWFEQSIAVGKLKWDWLSIQLDNSVDIMLGVSRLNGQDDSQEYSEGTWVDTDGKATGMSGAEFSVEARDHWASQSTGHNYPMGWSVTIPGRDLELELTPVFRDQELHGMHYTPMDYWEGEIEITGTNSGQPIHGQGYVELTGYQ